MSDLENRSFFVYFFYFALFEKAIALFVALFKRANEQAIAQSLY